MIRVKSEAAAVGALPIVGVISMDPTEGVMLRLDQGPPIRE